jgi:hypothetical protein
MTGVTTSSDALDALVDLLADRIADRVAAKLATTPHYDEQPHEWIDAKTAAEIYGVKASWLLREVREGERGKDTKVAGAYRHFGRYVRFSPDLLREAMTKRNGHRAPCDPR